MKTLPLPPTPLTAKGKPLGEVLGTGFCSGLAFPMQACGLSPPALRRQLKKPDNRHRSGKVGSQL